MSQDFITYTDTFSKEELMQLFEKDCPVNDWFNEGELRKFSLARNAGSLGARLLIKRRICRGLKEIASGNEIEILNDPLGKPMITLGETARQALKKAGFSRILCSISHSRNYIAGMTVFCR